MRYSVMTVALSLLLFVLCLSTTAVAFDPSLFDEPFEDFGEHEGGHKCIHDLLESEREARGESIPVLQQNEGSYLAPLSHEELIMLSEEAKENQKRGIYQTADRPPHTPIRIHIATDSLDNDPYTCYSEGQVIQAAAGSTLYTYTCLERDVLTPAKRSYLVDTLMAYGVDWLQNVLSVHRSIDGLTDISRLNTCGSPPITVPIPDRMKSGGIETDFILFVTARPILRDGTLAFASTCAINGIGRPIAGHANFNVTNLVDNPLDLPRKGGVAVHEICHALGFSSSRWNSGSFVEYLPGGSGNDWPTRSKPSSEVVVQVTGGTNYVFGRLISPSVVTAVRDHFGCSSMPGGDLEDSGGAGTAGSHWEKRIFANEFMTGTESNFPSRSSVTLALFEDSGWYEVDRSFSDQFIWGRSQGCVFTSGDCGSWTANGVTMGGLCSTANDPTVSCTFDRRAYGTCNIINNHVTPIPSHFQHYGGAYIGGQSSIQDYCGFIGQQGAATYCNTGGSSASQILDVLDFADVQANGESFGLESRCITSTLNKVNSPIEVESFADITPPAIRSPRCYPAVCAGPDKLRLSVERTWYRCPAEGGQLSVLGYGGWLECPPAIELCVDAPEVTDWPQITRISPTKGPPSTRITIYGINFNPNWEYEVEMEVLSTNVVVLNETTIEATIPGPDHFVSIADLALFQTQKHVIVREVSRGYTSHREDAFTMEVQFDGVYLENLFAWMARNPGWAILLWIIILCPSCCIAFCCYKILKKKKGKPQRGQFHDGEAPEQYYDDDYEVDEYYDEPEETMATNTVVVVDDPHKQSSGVGVNLVAPQGPAAYAAPPLLATNSFVHPPLSQAHHSQQSQTSMNSQGRAPAPAPAAYDSQYGRRELQKHNSFISPPSHAPPPTFQAAPVEQDFFIPPPPVAYPKVNLDDIEDISSSISSSSGAAPPSSSSSDGEDEEYNPYANQVGSTPPNGGGSLPGYDSPSQTALNIAAVPAPFGNDSNAQEMDSLPSSSSGESDDDSLPSDDDSSSPPDDEEDEDSPPSSDSDSPPSSSESFSFGL